MKKIILSLTMISAVALYGSVFAQDPVPPVKHPRSVNARLVRQQARINQGIKSGELTRGEAKNLELREANIAIDAKIDRAENGGKLTPAAHRNLEKRLNRESVRIYGKKHNGRTQ